ncbi:TPA: hypothetical protein SLO92_001216 [Klebsiella pneumoniae]|uniref:hypothetical protein n=1 Tax=Klebsiella TaxID=570 RepID=UPI0014382632|nr:hypothetical protein [Klebsiella pneumoniae]HDU4939435.1 hypothetical protein [Klebsiella pneumoniae subsp. pneumoniae]EIX9451372.1 hypothetical protein [Klebsiella pneumoniae]EKX1848818.1 hypothetical protein [Klebsiella pneumoniae]MBG2010799.1 hypothetical protein [Klebsiella pneumoniae]MBS2070333.1 hypothetical protein [Klebsiella pneumoniae]
MLLQDFIVPFSAGKLRQKSDFLSITDRVPAATYGAWLVVVINNNEKYEQYITPQFCAFAQTSTLACNNVRPVVYPPSDGEHEAQGIAGNLA